MVSNRGILIYISPQRWIPRFQPTIKSTTVAFVIQKLTLNYTKCPDYSTFWGLGSNELLCVCVGKGFVFCYSPL